MENHRRIQRQPAGWAASCQLVDEATAGWSDCRVIDISTLGVGITFVHPEPFALSGRQISVNLPGMGSSVNVRLEGEIKNTAPAIGGGVRVGIAFTRLSEAEQAITTVLSVMSDSLVGAGVGTAAATP